jgi:protein-disulfide isomerase
MFCADCGWHVPDHMLRCSHCGSGGVRSINQAQGPSESRPGLEPIVLSGTAADARRRQLAAAGRIARGETPNGPGTEAPPARRHPAKFIMLIGLVMVVAIGVVLWGQRLARPVVAAQPAASAVPPRTSSSSPRGPSTDQTVPPNATSDRSGIEVNPSAVSALVVVEYLDYQCPACRLTDQVFGSRILELANKGVIRLQFRAMTFLDDNLRNDSSTRAAIAAACADLVGSYGIYHRVIYQNQPAQEGAGFLDSQLRTSFPAAAGIAGPRLATFQKCYDTRATGTFVAGVNRAAQNAGVRSTPTLTLNGKDIRGQLNYKDVSSLDRALGTTGR